MHLGFHDGKTFVRRVGGWETFVRRCWLNVVDLAILCDLFGMVKWPFSMVKWPPTRGWKGHELNHLGKTLFFFDRSNSTNGRNLAKFLVSWNLYLHLKPLLGSSPLSTKNRPFGAAIWQLWRVVVYNMYVYIYIYIIIYLNQLLPMTFW